MLDRYADDTHYKGGVLMNENLGCAATMLSFSAAVPDPDLVPDWKQRWLHRLEHMPLLAKTWMEHQTRDDYWVRGSVCEDYGAITAATFVVGGWGDAYKNAVPRLLEHLTCPKQALVGPWIHTYPHFAVPDPAVGFLQEALAWWDRWLREDSTAPAPMYAHRPGRWVTTQGWPSDDVVLRRFGLGAGGCLVGGDSTQRESVSVRTPLTAGTGQGEFCAIWVGPDLPTDQRSDDA